MEVEVSIDGIDEPLVDFAEYIQNKLGSSEEYDCSVSIKAVPQKERNELPGSDIPTRSLTEPVLSEYGLYFHGEFEDNSDSPFIQISRLARQFFDKREEKYVSYGNFDGGKGNFDKYIYLEVDRE